MFLLRHGESLFNKHFTETRRDPGIEDPELTPVGHDQAAAAAARLAGAELTRIIVSPYTRALQTAAPILAHHKVRLEVVTQVRERAAFSCDVGSPPARLAMLFPQHDFAHLPETWWPLAMESEAETRRRADDFRAEMASRDDAATTLLISHWAFILALTGKSVTNGEILEYDPTTPAPGRIVWRP